MDPKSLPIWEIHQGIVQQLRAGNRLVLVAPTGSGKTTQVPQMILDAGLADESTPGRTPGRSAKADGPQVGSSTSSTRQDAGGTFRKIVVLQPRRVAARTVAARVAWERK